MHATRKCPWCAEEILVEAVRCRYCRGWVAALDPVRWHRSHPERRVAGVAAAVGHALAIPTPAVRVGFLVLTFIHLLGPMAYAALWLAIPFAPGERSPLQRATELAARWYGDLVGPRPGPPRAAAGPTLPGDPPA